MQTEDFLVDKGTISQEEEDAIHQEMEGILKTREKEHNDSIDKLTFTGKTRPFRFLVVINIVVGFLSAGAIGGAYAYFKYQDEKILKQNETISTSKNILARLLLKEARDLATKNQNKTDELKRQLIIQKEEHSKVEKSFKDEIEAYKRLLRKSLNEKLIAFRRKLKAQNISSKEITQKIKQKRLLLEKKHRKDIAQYTLRKNEEKQRRLETIDKSISVLEKKVNTKSSNIKWKEYFSEIKNLEKQEKVSLKSFEKTKQEVAVLRKEQEKRKKALESVLKSHTTVLSALNGEQYEDAHSHIHSTHDIINSSSYINDPEFVRIRDSLSTILKILDTIKRLKNSIETDAFLDTKSQKDIQKQVAEKKELEEILEKGQDTITQLQKEIDDLKNDKSLEELTSRYDALEIKYDSLQKGMMKNMQIIINYLFLKKEGKDTSQVQKLVNKLVREDAYYKVIGTLLARSLDPSGNLKF